MTTITDWKALLTAQLECLEALSEDDIGTEVYVRDSLSDEWMGPRILKGFSNPESTTAPFRASHGELGSGYYVLATKTLPIEPQTVTLIPWSGGECPVSSDTLVMISLRKGWVQIDKASYYSLSQWKHGRDVSYDHHIIAYRPITIDIEEG